MKRMLFVGMAGLLCLGLTCESFAGPKKAKKAKESKNVYQVKITNVTKGLLFTPILVVTHREDIALFELGLPASPELAMLAEGGDTVPLSDLLGTLPDLVNSVQTIDPLEPGQSIMVYVPADKRYDRLSLASMLLPTNDGLFSLNSALLPTKGSMQYTAPGYDAGSEENDELCASIPGAICGGEGYSPDDGEGYVHIHSGIHGIGDLLPEDFDWANPVAVIHVEQMRAKDVEDDDSGDDVSDDPGDDDSSDDGDGQLEN